MEKPPVDTGSEWVTPTTTGERRVLAWDDVVFEVDPEVGARVTALRLGGRNLLTGSEVDPGNFGSTFWTSPQSVWGWPPVPEIDHRPYAIAEEGRSWVFRSPPSASLGVQIGKRFAASRARGVVICDFRIENVGPAPLAFAPWQITRVHPGGLTFFPTGDGAFAPSNLAVREAGGVTWYDYDAAAITEGQKLFADGREGWLAHVDGDALLVKIFAACPRSAHAPGEAQIEIYASPAHNYVELEVQGRYERVAPGAALDWRVVWLVRRLPPDLRRAIESAALVGHVRRLVAADAAAADR